MYGTVNGNTCPAGAARIATEAACQTAASAMGLAYGSSRTDSTYPKGCYRWSDDGAVYFNPHATGGADAQSQPLCCGSAPTGVHPIPATRAYACHMHASCMHFSIGSACRLHVRSIGPKPVPREFRADRGRGVLSACGHRCVGAL